MNSFLTRHHPSFSFSLLIGLFILLLAGCTSSPEAITTRPDTFEVSVQVDGETIEYVSGAATVRELLEENNISLEELDELEPPGFTPLSNNLTVTITRISESFEVIQQTIPFERQFVRSESMSESDDPLIVQAGADGLQETTWRIVYRNGLESERWPTNSVIIDAPVEEIVMVGIGAISGNVTFSGLLAYMSDGVPVLMRGTSDFPVQLSGINQLDGRVFKLSPTGSHLLYTRAEDESSTQINNSLWVVSTQPNAEPRPLNIENVLWADWNPTKTELLEIAYTTARPTDAPPGWEANNDLWVGDVLRSETAVFTADQIIEAYPATYGWWGGNYAWAPNGTSIAYSFADEVGIIPVSGGTPTSHIQIQRFTEYNTLSDWVWVPTLSWSPNSQYIAFTNHGSENNRTMEFNSWVVNVQNSVGGQFVDQSGMWGHMHWSAGESGQENGRITYLKANDPIDSQRSNYTLWIMDEDGSNGRQLFPAVGENSQFPRYSQFLSWGPSGNDLSFVFNEQLYLYSFDTDSASRLTQDDATISHPTWAPYGAGLTAPLPIETPTPPPDPTDNLLPDE